jgi:hypothetical protein
MTLRLTPDNLAAAYEYLRSTLPFARWKLPHADEIGFRVTRHHGHIATHQGGNTCTIEVSSYCVGQTSTLMWAMGHEMIHLHQYLHGHETRGVVHNADFWRKARSACRRHGWDERMFV